MKIRPLRLGFLDGDHALLADLVHRLGDQVADGLVSVGADDAYLGDFVPLEAGVIDPTKVVRVALQNAASVASLMLTTEALITERSKGERDVQSAAMPDGMGGMEM